jgi:hypothetical protein
MPLLGLYNIPASWAFPRGVARIKKAREMGIDTERAIAILTGSGLKMIQNIKTITKE